MLKKSFAKNYLNTYLTSGFSIAVNFLSMFIVTPRLTEHPQVFGIFTLCLSTTVFLSYADLGFLGAAAKFSAEAFARKERERELSIIGFSSAILLAGALVFSLLVFLAGMKPDLIVKDILGDTSLVTLARSLFFILALSAPIIVLQRCVMVFFSVRLEDYIVQRIIITAGFFRIISTFYFFRPGSYDLVSYFIFSQLLVFMGFIASLILLSKRYDFKILSFFSSIRFTWVIFIETRSFAFTSLFSIVSWVLYYEFDPLAISKLLGSKYTAIYAIALSLMAVFRTLFGVLYAPFAARFNHFVGLGDEIGLKDFYLKIVLYTTPFIIFPVAAFMVFMDKVIICWVGDKFIDTIPLATILMGSYLFSSISYPTGTLLVARRKLAVVNRVSFMLPFFYWTGVYFLFNKWGLQAFAVFKFSTFVFSAIIYSVMAIRFLREKTWLVLREGFLPFFVSFCVFVLLVIPLHKLLPEQKGKLELLQTMATIGFVSITSIFSWILLHNKFRLELLTVGKGLILKKGIAA